MATPESNNPVTIARNKLPGVRRLIAALEAAGAVGMTPKEAALESGLAYGYVRRLLPILARAGKIALKDRGLYIANSAPPSQELHFENIVLVAKRKHNVAPRGAGDATQPVGQMKLERLTRRARGFGLPDQCPLRISTFYERFPVHIQDFPNGTLEIQVGSGGGRPMPVTDLIGFFGWVLGTAQGAVPALPADGPEGWHVRSWELPSDFEHLRLDGASSVSLRLFRDTILKAYNKPTGLRVELRQRMAISVADATALASRLADEFARLGLLEVAGGRSA